MFVQVKVYSVFGAQIMEILSSIKLISACQPGTKTQGCRMPNKFNFIPRFNLHYYSWQDCEIIQFIFRIDSDCDF